MESLTLLPEGFLLGKRISLIAGPAGRLEAISLAASANPALSPAVAELASP